MASREQQIFTKLRQLCVDLFGADKVYDYLPGADAEYPFVFIGEQFAQTFREHKDGQSKETQVTLHVWHDNPRQRGTVSSMMEQIQEAIIEEFGVKGEQVNLQILADNTTGVPLLHGIVDTNIKY